ncbi:MAG: bifunctional serine/threonine-protein kinase/formylglycine-generating enzyme family protein, partial [Myxococcota bacterium]|nr:bifunctional serine/threonine-protein kinase/formylglycine-generating enzyme family protein [Myxococcota bacterium]
MLGPGQQVGDWIVEAQIGAGAMGAVYRTHSVLSENLKSAVKVLRQDEHPEARSRFLREIETLARLDHRAIVRILGSGEDESHRLLYLVMELLDGESLAARLKRKPVPLRTAVRWFHRLSLGLQHAHKRGVAHRDVKPSNIMLLGSGEVRLVDFGIAVTDDAPPITQAGIVVGTFSYLAPEAFLEADPDLALSDQYSLAQVLCEVLTNQAAFPRPVGVEEGRWMALLARQKSNSPALDPGDGLPSGLRAIIRRATQRDPSKRFESMAHFAQSLGEVSLLAPAQRSSMGPTAVGMGSPRPEREPADRGGMSTEKAVTLAGIAGFGIALAGGAAAWLLRPPGPAVDDVPVGEEESLSLADLAAREVTEAAGPGAVRVDPDPARGVPDYPLVEIIPGAFELGCTASQYGCDDDEQPVTVVEVNKPIRFGQNEVTQALWQAVMDDQPSAFDGCGAGCPVEQVSWCEALIFANALSVIHGHETVYRLPKGMEPGLSRSACDAMAVRVTADLDRDGYRLPTEAEWEYAARAGTDLRYAGGDEADGVAWTVSNSRDSPHPVGQKAPNGFGLHDMSGNVWEWIWDGYAAYPGGQVPDRVAPPSGPWRVLRGGSFGNLDTNVRVADRDRAHP